MSAATDAAAAAAVSPATIKIDGCNLPTWIATAIGCPRRVPFVNGAVIAKGTESEKHVLFAKSKYWAMRCAEQYDDIEAALFNERQFIRFTVARAERVYFVKASGFTPTIIAENVGHEVKTSKVVDRTTVHARPEQEQQPAQDYTFYRFSCDATSTEDLSKFHDLITAAGLVYERRKSHRLDAVVGFTFCVENANTRHDELLKELRKFGGVYNEALITSSARKAMQLTIRPDRESMKDTAAVISTFTAMHAELVKRGVEEVWFRPSGVRICAPTEKIRDDVKLFYSAQGMTVISDAPPPKQPKEWTPAQLAPPEVVVKSTTVMALKAVRLTPLPVFVAAATLIGATVVDHPANGFTVRVISWGIGKVPQPTPSFGANTQFAGLVVAPLNEGVF